MPAAKSTPFHYDYIPGVSQYSAGVQAQAGHEIVRARLASTPALADGFDLVEEHLQRQGLDHRAVCAFELRSPEQFTEATFADFNETYIGRLRRWGVISDGDNPVARANVIPNTSDLTGPSLHAFSYVRPAQSSDSSFVIAGSGEAPEGRGNYRDHIVALGDTTEEGIAKKAEFVIGEMERRMSIFGAGWGDVTDVQVYTVYPYHLMHRTLAESVPTSANITWHFCHPPVEGLAFEMDCRRVSHEEVVRR